METPNRNEFNRKSEDNLSGISNGKALSGLIVVLVGSVLLARELGVEIPRWVIGWETLLIVIGLYIGAKHGFKSFGWLVPVAIGSIFLADHILPDLNLRPYLIPIIIIFVGLVIIFRPKGRRCGRRRWGARNDDRTGNEAASSEDFIDSTSIFGGVEKNIISKDFKGGDVVTFFGGASLNMSQSDIQKRAVLDITQVFGGTEIVVPAHWKIQSELVTIFGGIEDKRGNRKEQLSDSDKVLVLRGTCIFGGIDISSY